MKVTFLIGLLVLAAASGVSATSDVTVDLAYFRPDRGDVKFDWTEGWGHEEQFYPKYTQLSGAFHVTLKNSGSSEVKITKILLNGRPLPELRKELSVVWWRVLTNPVPAGGLSEVTIKLRYPPDRKTNEIVLYTDTDEIVRCEVLAERPVLSIGYVGFSKTIDELHIYVEGDAGQALSGIYLDGQDVTSAADIYPRFKSMSTSRGTPTRVFMPCICAELKSRLHGMKTARSCRIDKLCATNSGPIRGLDIRCS